MFDMRCDKTVVGRAALLVDGAQGTTNLCRLVGVKPLCHTLPALVRYLWVCSVATVFVGAPNAAAQSTCPVGNATALLEGHDVVAQVFNTGFLFYDATGTVETRRYNVPKDGNAALVYGAGIWLSGTIRDTLTSSVAYWGHQDFRPGPLDDDGIPTSDCSRFNRVWSVTLEDLTAYEEDEIATDDITSWPTGLGAPTRGVDGEEIDLSHLPFEDRLDRVIDLDAGERPYLRGAQTHWWVVNDKTDSRAHPDNPPMGVEIGVTAFVFDVPGALGRSTFFEYDIRKPTGPVIEDAYIGMYSDVDLGYFDDDFLGSDSLLGLAYIYNAEETDGIFDPVPPAVGIDFLRGPFSHLDGIDNNGDGTIDEPGERQPMGAARLPVNTRTDPVTVRNYFLGRMAWGDPMVSYGRGWMSGGSDHPWTRWQFWGDPGEYWSELNIDGQGSANLPSDRRMVTGAGPVMLGPDNPQELFITYITSFGDDHIDSVRKLKVDSRFLQGLADNGTLDEFTGPAPEPPVPDDRPLSAALYPVPASTVATLRYHLPNPQDVRVEVYDLLGRRVDQQTGSSDQGTQSLTLDVSGWAPGIYVAHIRIGVRSFFERLVVAR